MKEHLSDEISKELFWFSIFLDGENLGDDVLYGSLAVMQSFVG